MDIELLIQEVPLDFPAINIAAGSYHSIAVCEGEVRVWGKDEHCNLGERASEEHSNSFKRLRISVSEAQGGGSHTFAWRENEVFCWGCNSSYELGLEGAKEFQLTKSQIFEDAFQAGLKLSKIACGETHSLAVFEEQYGDSDESCIFAWGDSKNYQLGLETNSTIPQPVQIDFNAKVKVLRSRSDFNVLVTQAGECYSWGSNIFNRAGFPNSIKNHKIPTKINSLVRIETVALGKYHCVAIDGNGKAFSWGHGMHGQLALNKLVSEIGPTPIDFPDPILQASCGESHTLVLTVNNLYSCGSNAYNALGHKEVDHKKRCLILKKVQKLPVSADRIKKIVCGYRHNVILTKEGSVFCWGCNKFNQMGSTHRSGASNRSPISNVKSLDFHDYSQEKSEERMKQVKTHKQQRLMDWKQKYQIFKFEQEKKERQFLDELQKILSDPN